MQIELCVRRRCVAWQGQGKLKRGKFSRVFVRAQVYHLLQSKNDVLLVVEAKSTRFTCL
jgi:hypothetical protein